MKVKVYKNKKNYLKNKFISYKKNKNKLMKIRKLKNLMKSNLKLLK